MYMHIYVRHSLGQGGLTTAGSKLNMPQTSSSYCLYERRRNFNTKSERWVTFRTKASSGQDNVFGRYPGELGIGDVPECLPGPTGLPDRIFSLQI